MHTSFTSSQPQKKKLADKLFIQQLCYEQKMKTTILLIQKKNYCTSFEVTIIQARLKHVRVEVLDEYGISQATSRLVRIDFGRSKIGECPPIINPYQKLCRQGECDDKCYTP